MILLLIPAVKLSFHFAPSREVRGKGHLHTEHPLSAAVSQWGIADLLKGRTRAVCTLHAHVSCVPSYDGRFSSVSYSEYLQKNTPH